MLTSVTFSKPHRIPQRKTARAGPAFPLQAPLDSLTLAASVVIQQDVARRAGAEVRPRLVYTLMLAEELREAALIHIWGRQVTPAVHNHRRPGDGNLVVICSSPHSL